MLADKNKSVTEGRPASINIEEQEKTKLAENQFATYFKDFKPNKESLRYVTIFFARRYLMVLILTLLPKYRNV